MKLSRGAAAILGALLWVATMGRLWAEPASIAVMQSPVVYVTLTSGKLTVHTWDRPEVAVQSDGNANWQHFNAQQTERHLPQNALLIGRTEQSAQGEISLPPEPVTLPSLGDAPHDGVVIRGDGDTDVTVPSSTALIVARVMHGGIELSGYHNGTFVTQVGGGYELFKDVGGVGITQVLNGPIVAENSDFSHVRARTLRGNMLFENCNVREIEATSVLGSITYDNGSFQPGLARFESQFGNVAIGVNGRAEIGAHSAAGQIYATSGGLQRRGNSDAQASFGSGGPVVTASSERGKVILYSGSIRNNPQLRQHVGSPRAELQTLRGRPPGRPRGGRPPL